MKPPAERNPRFSSSLLPRLQAAFSQFDIGWIAALVLALPLLIRFLPAGLPLASLPGTADAEIHLHRILSAAVNLDAGYLWPRWSPYLHHGYGYPIHNFYAPGLHIVGGLLYLLTRLDPAILLKLLLLAAILAYPLGAYGFARTFTGRASALVAAAAYTYAPFRFHELWVQTNLSQFWAMALIPYLFWTMARLASAERAVARWRGVAIVGVCFAAIVLLHHPTAFLIAPFAGLYALYCAAFRGDENRAGWREPIATAALLCGGLALGLLLSAIFWLPALLELRYTQISEIEQGMFSVTANFISLGDAVRLVAPVDRALLNSPTFYSVGLPQVVAAVLGLGVLVIAWQRARRGEQSDLRLLRLHVLAGALVLALCVWLMTPTSAWVWLNLPIARLIVYPWRLLGVAALAALPGAAALPMLFSAQWRNVIAGVCILVFAGAGLPMLYAPLSFYDVPPATPETTLRYEMSTGNLGLTSGNEYLPVWSETRPLQMNPLDYTRFEWRVDLMERLLPAGVVASRAQCERGASCFRVENAESFTLLFHQLYFPGWTVRVDGQAVETRPETDEGLLAIEMPAGAHNVLIRYGGTPVQAAGAAISGAGTLITAALLIVSLRRRSPASQLSTPEHTPSIRALAIAVIVGVVLFVLADQAMLLPNTALFRPQSDPTAPPAQHALRIPFRGVGETAADEIVLVGYDLEQDSIAPGGTVTVRLYWHTPQPLTHTLRGAVRLTARDGQADWGGRESLSLAGFSRERWTAAGYGVDTYTFDVAEDAPPYVGDLRVSVFTTEGDYLLTETGDVQAVIGTMRVTGNRYLVEDSVLTPITADFGGQVALAGTVVEDNEAGETCITLRWRVQAQPQADYTVMLHLLNAAGNAIAFHDAPPLDGLYPMSAWQAGQVLDDRHCFARPPEATDMRIALYTQVGDSTPRLPLRVNGQSAPDDALTIVLPPG